MAWATARVDGRRVGVVLGFGVLTGACWLSTNLDGFSTDAADSGADSSRIPSDASPDAPSDGSPSGADAGAYANAVLADGPIAYWRLGDSTKPTAKDATGRHDSVYERAAMLGVPGALAGDPDTAISTDGTTPVLTLLSSDFAFSGNAPFSLELWLSPATIDNGFRFVFMREELSPRNGYGVYVHSDEGIAFERVRDGLFNVTNGPIPANVWSHVAFAYDGAMGFTYIDGAEIQRAKFPVALSASSVALTVGFGGGVGFIGALDEIAIYDKALSAERVLAHVRAGRGR